MSSTYQSGFMAGERPLLSQKEMRSSQRKFHTNDYQHFNIMIRVKSPQAKHGKPPSERMRIIKDSMTAVVGNQVAPD